MKSQITVFFLLFLLIPPKVFSQQIPADTMVAQSLYYRAVDLQKTAKYDSAMILLDSSRSIFATVGNDGEQMRCLIIKADCLKAKSSYEKAIDALRIDSEMEHRLLSQKPVIEAQRLVMLGSIYREQAKYDTALVLASRALIIEQQNVSADRNLEWDIYTLFAGTYFNLGENDSALSYNIRALQLFPLPEGEQRLKVSGTYNGIAGIYETRGDYQKALDYFLRSLDIRKKVLGEKHPDIANLYNNTASIYFRSGDHDRALEYYFKSLSIMNETLQNDHPSFGIRYNNIAMAYRGKKEYGKAIQFGLQSKSIFVKKLGEKHPNVAGVVNNIGRTYSDMKEYKRALASYLDAMSIWKEKLGEKHSNVSQSYFNIGEAYGNLREFDKAKEWLDRSLVTRLETLGKKNVKVAQAYNALGSVYTVWGKPDSALTFYQNAILTLCDSIDDASEVANRNSIINSNDIDLVIALTGKAKTLFIRGTNAKNVSDLKTSLKTYELAFPVVDNIRRGFGSENSKILLSQLSFDIYEQSIAVALKLFELTRENRYTAAAFSIAERSKANILRDAISEQQAKQYSGIPDSLLEQESSLRISRTYYTTQIQKEKDKREKANTTKILQWENLLFDYNRHYEQLIERFEKNYPEYYSLQHQQGIVSLNDIQKQLPNDKTALLEYVVGDSTVIIFAVTKNRCVIRSQSIGSLNTIIKQFRRSIQNVESEEYVDAANRLYKQLIAPVQSNLKGITKLYIIPDGILNYIPFEALLTKRSSPKRSVDFSTLSYLLNRYEISYQPSAKFITEHNKLNFVHPALKREKEAARGFVGIAPVFLDQPSHSKGIYSASAERVKRSRTIDGERFTELKESEGEIKNIFNLFKVHHQTAAMFLHNEAKESSIKSAEMGNYRFVHIATHGMINEDKPNLSGIIFTEPKYDSLEDGILYSGEIYNLHLNADLVVLSACETGLGTIIQGEGILGFTRGFKYAGAQNLLVSLWQVADQSTADLMVKFYQNVLNGQSYSTALRHAKRTMIKQKKYSHPVEWSPFVLTGM